MARDKKSMAELRSDLDHLEYQMKDIDRQIVKLKSQKK